MKKILSSLLVMIAFASQAFAVQYQDLTDAQKASIEKGEQVFITEPATHGAWPKVYIFQSIDSTVQEATAMFFDYELQKDYISSLNKSKISLVHSPVDKEIDYILAVPFLRDEWYTVRDVLSREKSGEKEALVISWSLVKARTTIESEGYARFESLGNKTLLSYYNFVVPGSSLAGMVREKAMKQVRDTAKAIVTQVATEKTENPALLKTQMGILEEALKSL